MVRFCISLCVTNRCCFNEQMPPISNDKRNSMKSDLLHGCSCREVSRAHSVSLGFVSQLRRELGPLPENRPGRPKKISDVSARNLLRGVRTGRIRYAVIGARQLRADDIHVVPQTVRNLLHRAGFKSIPKKDALPLTPDRCKDRLEWANAYKDLTKED